MSERVRRSIELNIRNRILGTIGKDEMLLYLTEEKLKILLDDIMIIVNTFMEDKK